MISVRVFIVSCYVFYIYTVKTAEYPLRLIRGPSVSSGRLQVLMNGTWGRICVGSNKQSFSVEAGNVACKQLGYQLVMQVCQHTCIYRVAICMYCAAR